MAIQRNVASMWRYSFGAAQAATSGWILPRRTELETIAHAGRAQVATVQHCVVRLRRQMEYDLFSISLISRCNLHYFPQNCSRRRQ